jgi:hypothetical protein
MQRVAVQTSLKIKETLVRRFIGVSVVMVLILSAGGTQLTTNTGPPPKHNPPPPNDTGTVTISTSGQTTSTPASTGRTGGHSSGGGGGGYVCSKNGLPISTSVNSSGYLTISYTGSTGGITAQTIQKYQQYADCVTSAKQQMSTTCHMHMVNGCIESLNITPIKWSGGSVGSNGSPGTLVNIPAVIKTCKASFSPQVQSSKVSITGLQVFPQTKWLLNLPVEYAYSSSATPTVSFQGATGKSCNVAIGKAISGSVNLSASGLSYHVSSGPAKVSMTVFGQPGNVIATSQACDYHNNTLIPPSQLPNYQGNLAAYQTYFQGHRICTVTPSGTSFQSVAVHKTPIQFDLTRNWEVSYSYNESSSVSITQSGKTSSAGGSSTSVSGTVPITATYRSPTPIYVSYIVGQECSFTSSSGIVCPQSNG